MLAWWKARWVERRHAVFAAALVLLAGALRAQTGQGEPAAPAYAVGYLEVMPSSRATVVAALNEYRSASRSDDGAVSFEVFEQIGRAGHFAVIETWRDQKALDVHRAAAHTTRLHEKLRPIRLSEYDERPYKPFSIGPAPAAPVGRQAICVITHVDTTPGPQFDAPGLLKRLADDSRKDGANLRFDVLQHTMRANHFTVIELWRDAAALDRHAAASHTIEYRGGLQPMAGSPLDERLYKSVD
jgi:quinol monooxygenase YgiN